MPATPAIILVLASASGGATVALVIVALLCFAPGDPMQASLNWFAAALALSASALSAVGSVLLQRRKR
jgi:hypothetical protein